MPVEVAGHEDAGATLVSWALTTETVDLSVLVHLTQRKTISPGQWFLFSIKEFSLLSQIKNRYVQVSHLVVLEHSELDLLSLVLVLLGGGVRLLLPLLSTTTQPQHQVQGGLLEQTKTRRFQSNGLGIFGDHADDRKTLNVDFFFFNDVLPIYGSCEDASIL